MTGRMESMENLAREIAECEQQREVFHPSQRPLEIVRTIPTFPQPRLRRFSLTKQKTTGHFYSANHGDISIRP
jgi:hypothetical protein